MRKQIFAALIVLMMLLTGCSTGGAVPDDMNELVSEAERAADTEAASSPFPSESKESDAHEEAESSDSTATPETAAETEPPKEQSKPQETTPAAAAPKESQTPPASEETAATPPPAVSDNPKETPMPAETTPEPTPQPTPEETKPKSAYDYEFDIDTIKADCISIGKGMGLSVDSSLTPSNAAWWNPVTASQSSQGTSLKQSLESYIQFHTVDNLGAYGIDAITSFNIYCEARGNGVYAIHFLFA